MKRMIIFLAAALVLPTSVALAAQPSSPGKSAPKVQYVLRGTLSGYTAATDTTTGQISIMVKHSNYHARALKNQSLTFTLTAGKSKVTFRRGSHAHGQIVDGTKGYITFRAPKRISGDLVTELPNQANKRTHVVVLRAPAA
jgi:hypothetical protein